jgi:hypothetical protein
LGKLRSGNLTPQVTQFFKNLTRPLPVRDDGLVPTLLKVTNAAAKEINIAQLKQLKQPILHFQSLDGSQQSGDDPRTSRTNERHAASCKLFWDNCNADPDVEFALGAQVIIFSKVTQIGACRDR